MQKKILYFDMDNVLVNFQSGVDRLDEKTKQAFGEYYDNDGSKHEAHYDDVPGIFALMDPIEGAIEAVRKLAEKYDVYILSTAPWKNPTALNDKLAWVKKYFGGEDEKNVFHKRVIFSHHKNLCHGDYLVDDRPDKCGVGKFSGEVLHFDVNDPKARFRSWDAVVEYLMGKKENLQQTTF